MKAYKGFKKDMTCRKFQFEEGKTYEEQEAKLCEKGFHACDHPLACFGYYAPSDSVFHEVELDCVADERGSDTKVVAKKITIGARLDIAGMVKAAVDFVFSRADWSKKEQHATGDQGAASAAGRWGAASATGDQGAAVSLGINGKAKASHGCWITLAEWRQDNKTYKWERVDVKTRKVDGVDILPDTWYQLKNGQFVPAAEDVNE